MQNRLKAIILTTSILSALVACGGGGGSDSGASTQATAYPVQAAIGNVYSKGIQTTLPITGTISNGTQTSALTGSITFSISAAVATTFNGTPALQAVSTAAGTLIANGQSSPLNSTTTEYLSTAYAPLGSSSSTNYCIAATLGVVPPTVTVGQTGTIVRFTCYADSTKQKMTGFRTVTYVSTAGKNNALNFQIVTTTTDPDNKVMNVEGDTYAITTAGAATLIQVTTTGTSDGITVSITAQ